MASFTEIPVTPVKRTVETQLVTPILCRLLQSSAHRVASRWTMLISYIGPESRLRYTFPVVYTEIDSALVVVTPKAESKWWLNFQTSMDCYVWYRGEPQHAVGTVVTGDEANDLLAEYALTHALVARQFSLSANRYELYVQKRTDLAVVRFEFKEDRWTPEHHLDRSRAIRLPGSRPATSSQSSSE